MRSNWLLTLRSFFLSVVLHIVLGCLLLFSFTFSSKPLPVPQQKTNIIKATTVNSEQVQQELKRFEDEEKAKKQSELKYQKELEEKITTLVKERKAEEKRLSELQKKIKLEQKKQKIELEKQRRLEEERKKKEIEQKKREKEERKYKEREKQLQQALEAEQQAQQEKQDLRDIQKYTLLIARAVESNFNKLGLPENLSCIILIRLLEGGKVAGVSITKSSGNRLFDKRAETAVYSSSPLPVPSEERIFNKMKTIEFTFTPIN